MSENRTGTVYVYVPSVPEGKELEIPGLGGVKNGETKEVSERLIASYEAAGYVWPESGELSIVIPTPEEVDDEPHPVGPLNEDDPVDATSDEGDNE